jgi:GMP synthase-like glutamine amidotransferase
MPKKLRIHYLQHVPFEDPGSIHTWIISKGHQVSCTRFFENDTMPNIEDIDWLIVMGGPMGVHDEVDYPWLIKEKKYIRQAIIAGKTVIGICLGAQLISLVLGGKVYPNPEKEIGWHPVQLSKKALEHPSFQSFEKEFPVFHWHGDTFDLPPGATPLAESDACKNQAFLYNEHVLGLQFHLEITEDGVYKLLRHCKNELTQGKYIQPADEIIAGLPYIPINTWRMENLLNRLSAR